MPSFFAAYPAWTSPKQDTGTALRRLVHQTVTHPLGPDVLGYEFRAQRSEPELAAYATGLYTEAELAKDLEQVLLTRIRSDRRTANVVCVDGWVVAEAEAYACAIALDA